MSNVKAGMSVRSPLEDASLQISAGVWPGISHINKFGRNTAAAAGGGEEIWDGSADYVFPATALMTSISQTADQVALRGETIELQGLDANWDMVTQNATLDGTLTTNVVTLATPMIRVFRMKVQSSVVADSTIRCHNAGETQDYAVISVGKQQTQMAMYTIPDGHTGFVDNVWANHNPTTGQTFTSNLIELWVKDNINGYAAQMKFGRGIAEDQSFQHSFNPYLKVPQRSDVFLTASPVGAAADVSAGFDLVLLDDSIYGT